MAEKQAIDRGTWLALIAMGIAVFVVANDFSAINVAIPQIEEDFDISVIRPSGWSTPTRSPSAC